MYARRTHDERAGENDELENSNVSHHVRLIFVSDDSGVLGVFIGSELRAEYSVEQNRNIIDHKIIFLSRTLELSIT